MRGYARKRKNIFMSKEKDVDIKEMISILEYDSKWLDFKFIDEVFISSQITIYKTTDDKNTEHYRIAAFNNILEQNYLLDDKQIEQYIELAKIDKDEVMAKGALMNLLVWPRLKDQQFENLILRPEFADKVFQQRAKRKIMMKEVESLELTDESVEFYIKNGDSNVQLKLLSKPDITRKQLVYINENGINRSVRNIAKNMLRSNRYK
jgi:hypothetical protein